mmetsp:Transcript_5779/g.16287  ORF Transcript_5779/g.16287 Transcript_5779/m.16287 type:complete len:291 (+) Transcript_5779:127-999(+)|eukprot:CAMPEP_0181031426 /NCGR_PEP_ID=MMETSP1070-20121207/6226_1 /TAXON_ID=265543 /ORGANISM="Minutocellus polymorphus, Strain NH13" /LENGTH=290 /DNA_ID=CAMNT_0023108803 /DNA_START=109 /DNA_END=981 /DNA_ORIENTATION=-
MSSSSSSPCSFASSSEFSTHLGRNEEDPPPLNVSIIASSGIIYDDIDSKRQPNPKQTLSDLCHKAALLHNTLGAINYQQSRYNLSNQHFRRGIDLLIQAESCDDTGDACRRKCAEVRKHVIETERKYDDLLCIVRHAEATRRHNHQNNIHATTQVCRGEPILLNQQGKSHWFKNDGTLEEIHHHPTLSNMLPSASVSGLISSIIMHNLALCHSAVGSYGNSLKLICMARETAKLAGPLDTTHEVSCIYMVLVRSLDRFEDRFRNEFEASIANGSVMAKILASSNDASAAA